MQLLGKTTFLTKEFYLRMQLFVISAIFYLRMQLFVIAAFLKQSALFKNVTITTSRSLK